MTASHRTFRFDYFLNKPAFLILVFQVFFAFTLFAQTDVKLFYFKNVEDKLTREKLLQKILKSVVHDEESSPEDWHESATVTFAKIGSDTYYLISYSPLLYRLEDEGIFLIRVRAETQKKWHLKKRGIRYETKEFPYRTDGSLRADKSYLFLLNNDPVLSINHYFYDYHTATAESVSFFSLKDDSFSYIGTVATHFTDNYGDGEDLNFTRKLKLLSGDLDTILIRSLYFVGSRKLEEIVSEFFSGFSPKYREEFQLTHDSLQLTKNRILAKEYVITLDQAKEFIKNIFQDYYSDEWKKRDKEWRTSYFLDVFGVLQELRSDFAPAYYNKACMQSILGKNKDALDNLKKALELDAGYKVKAKRDSDLKSLQELAEFKKMVK